MKSTEKLTTEKFQEIYTNEEFRNQVAFAHAQCNTRGEEQYKITCSYPVTYIVTEKQIELANAEYLRAKAQAITDNKGKFMLVGMGSSYTERYTDDVCNHRVRGEFQAPNGNRFFIEFGTGTGDRMRIDHAVDRTVEIFHNNKIDELAKKSKAFPAHSKEWNEIHDQIREWHKQPYYNYKGLERRNNMPQYTKQNILTIVNDFFDCSFREVVIDSYNVSSDDFINISPK